MYPIAIEDEKVRGKSFRSGGPLGHCARNKNNNSLRLHLSSHGLGSVSRVLWSHAKSKWYRVYLLIHRKSGISGPKHLRWLALAPTHQKVLLGVWNIKKLKTHRAKARSFY